MTLRSIPPPVLPPSISGVKIINAWETNTYVYYLIDYSGTSKFIDQMLWVQMKERGVGGRIIEPNPKAWEDLRGNAISWGWKLSEQEIREWIERKHWDEEKP